MIHSQLRSFHAVATEGGFTAAAKVINVGQPTISIQIMALEDLYGVQLFHRQGRNVVLTDCGMALKNVSQKIFNLEDEAHELLNNYEGLRSGLLKVGAVGPYHATPILAKFNKDYPGIKLKVSLGNSMRTLDRLFDYSVDVAVLAHVADNPTIHAVPYSRHPVVVFVNKNHPFAARQKIRLEELQSQPFIYREQGSTTRLAFENTLKDAGVSVDIVLEMGSREAVWSTVEQGMGIGVVSDIEFVPHPNLCIVEISDANIYTTAHLACLEDRKDTKIIKTFFDVATVVKNNKKFTAYQT